MLHTISENYIVSLFVDLTVFGYDKKSISKADKVTDAMVDKAMSDEFKKFNSCSSLQEYLFTHNWSLEHLYEYITRTENLLIPVTAIRLV